MGYNERGFFPLWDTTEKFFSAAGYNREGFPTLWDTTEEDFFHCGIQRRTISGWQTNFVLLNPTMQEIFLPLYPIPQQNLVQCTVSQKNLPTTPQVFFHCIPQWKIFSSVVGNNGRGFFSLWDTTEEAFTHCGIQRKSFFPLWNTTEEVFFSLWDTMKKKHTTQNDIFTF